MRDFIRLRPTGPDEEPFLYQVYASTRTEELQATGWDDGEKERFLRMQFNAQHRFYHEMFPDASYDIILWKNQTAGRLYVDRRAEEIAVVDIALLPEFRGLGIGEFLLREVKNEAIAAGKPVRIYVEHFNRAQQLYRRLGFRSIGDTGVYYHMEW